MINDDLYCMTITKNIAVQNQWLFALVSDVIFVHTQKLLLISSFHATNELFTKKEWSERDRDRKVVEREAVNVVCTYVPGQTRVSVCVYRRSPWAGWRVSRVARESVPETRARAHAARLSVLYSRRPGRLCAAWPCAVSPSQQRCSSQAARCRWRWAAGR